MKVLHIYSGNLFGGIETFLITLARERALCPAMEPSFVLCFEGRLSQELKAINAQVYMLEEVHISRPWTIWQARQQLKKLLAKQHFDIVICHSIWPMVIFGAEVKAAGIPLVFWCHDIPQGKHWLERLAKLVQPDFVIANSQYTQKALPHLYPKSPNGVIYYPVADIHISDQTAIRRAVRNQLNTPEEAVVIIQTSRLERWKGQSALISALAYLQDTPNWICWIVGGAQRPHEMEYFKELQKNVHKYELDDRLRFLGQRNDVQDLLVSADIHCQLNLSPEPFGITFIEALYAGLPVVTPALGAASEIIDESCGCLIKPHDLNASINTLRAIIQDKIQRLNLGINGPTKASKICNPSKQINQLFNCLLGVIKTAK